MNSILNEACVKIRTCLNRVVQADFHFLFLLKHLNFFLFLIYTVVTVSVDMSAAIYIYGSGNAWVNTSEIHPRNKVENSCNRVALNVS